MGRWRAANARQVCNIDAADGGPDYEIVNDVFNNLLALECQPESRARSSYLQQQPHLNARMRAILVDYLVTVHADLQMTQASLHLTGQTG